MDLILTRFRRDAGGIFSYLKDSAGNQLAVTLEHAYQNADGSWSPKIPDGDYICQRGVHQLMIGIPFETFEVTQVPQHWGILFHQGNWNPDSEGCILVGTSFGTLESQEAILNSMEAFSNFMQAQIGVNQFWLHVETP